MGEFGAIMPKQGEKKSQNLNSALNLWQEAVEKASVDLEKIVNSCIQRLETFSKELERSLDEQLERAARATASSIEANAEELVSQKELLQREIVEFEREKIETMLNTAHESRARIDKLVRDTKSDILDQFNFKLDELTELLADPRKHFEDFEEQKEDIIDEVSESAREKTVETENEVKQRITEKVEMLSEAVDMAVEETRRTVESKLAEFDRSFDQKIEMVLAQLDEVYNVTQEASQQSVDNGIGKLAHHREANEKFLDEKVSDWSKSVENLKDSFENEMETRTSEHFKNHINRLEYRVSEAKATMNHLSNDANSRVSAIHKTYYSSLKRLERKYQERIQKQLAKLEQLIAQESMLPQSNKVQAEQIKEELEKKLDSQIKVRGNELVKSVRKQVEQLEGDFRRRNMNSTEQIDSIRLQAIESLDKQVRIIRSELERIHKTFNSELSHLSTELPEIEERGHVAAMSVSAYLASMLTLESD